MYQLLSTKQSLNYTRQVRVNVPTDCHYKHHKTICRKIYGSNYQDYTTWYRSSSRQGIDCIGILFKCRGIELSNRAPTYQQALVHLRLKERTLAQEIVTAEIYYIIGLAHGKYAPYTELRNMLLFYYEIQAVLYHKFGAVV